MQLFVDQLVNVDFSYFDPARGLVGETWWASVALDGELNEQGMVFDFGLVKKTLRHWLDERIDHCLLIPATHPNVTIHHMCEQTIDVTWLLDNGQHIRMQAPIQSVALIDSDVINEHSVARWCEHKLAEHFPVQVHHCQMQFAAEAIPASSAYYHYSHGLKKHDGNCQRIAHGHRSRIEIYMDDERNAELESQWAKRWQDIYLASKEDEMPCEHTAHRRFGYDAKQGRFELELPSDACYIMNTDTTVELIAKHLHDVISGGHTNRNIRVRAFEGVNKGACIG